MGYISGLRRGIWDNLFVRSAYKLGQLPFGAYLPVLWRIGKIPTEAIKPELELELVHHRTMDPTNKSKGPSPHYSLYQREVFKKGGTKGICEHLHVMWYWTVIWFGWL